MREKGREEKRVKETKMGEMKWQQEGRKNTRKEKEGRRKRKKVEKRRMEAKGKDERE